MRSARADKGRAVFARAWNVFSTVDVCIYIGRVAT